MNERIKELAEQAKLRPALLLKHWGKIDALTDSEQKELEQLELFAELIIRGCISQVALLGISNFENDDVGWTVDKSIENIRKHFGVENETK